MDHQEYLERRDELLKIRTDSHNSFDKAVLSLATGSLALSIAFLDKIGTPYNRLTFVLILVTWVGLFLVIVANLLSYLFAKSNMDKKIKELDETYREQTNKEKADDGVEKIFWHRRATNICNNAAFIVFTLSIVTFICYIIAIQRHNFIEFSNKHKEEAVMSMKKTPGATETTAALAKPVRQEGQTEVKRAVPSPRSINTFGETEAPQAVSVVPGTITGGISTRGATEVPAAVQKPPSNPPPKFANTTKE